jgi:hypothetical protein
MGHTEQEAVTRILLEYEETDHPAAVADKLYPLVYDELRELARQYLKGEKAGHTLQPTALVNEAYIRLIDSKQQHWQNRAHFLPSPLNLCDRSWSISPARRVA